MWHICQTSSWFLCVQLFDKDNHVNKALSGYLFTTEGHLFPIDGRWRHKPWKGDKEKEEGQEGKVPSVVDARHNVSNVSMPALVVQLLPKCYRYYLPPELVILRLC